MPVQHDGRPPLLFPDSRERMKALGVWGGIGGVGGTVGSVISGALTSVDWRWIFYINIPVVLFALVMVPRVLPESPMVRAGHRIDVAGAVTAGGGLVAVVYGLLQASSHPWGSVPVLLPLLGGAGLLAVMVAVEARFPEALIPVQFFVNRTRVTSNVLSVVLFASPRSPSRGYAHGSVSALAGSVRTAWPVSRLPASGWYAASLCSAGSWPWSCCAPVWPASARCCCGRR